MLDDRGRSYHAEKEGLREFVGRVPWTHFVTLAFNDPMVRIDRMHERLKNWDQRVNRRMLGSRYRRKPHERVLWMAFLEKPRSNPHWHLVLELTEEQIAREQIAPGRSFSRAATLEWAFLVPCGTIDIQRVEDDGVNAYVTKAAASGISFENFVHARQMLKL